VRTAVFTTLALVAFAGNSLLCRMALGQATIDAASFSTIRIIAGAICLWLITVVTRRGSVWTHGSWLSAAILFVYAIPFAYAGRMFVVGRGAEFATAREIALKLLETCRIAAEPLTATDLAHGPVAALDSLFPVWAIASDDATLPAVVEAVERARGQGPCCERNRPAVILCGCER